MILTVLVALYILLSMSQASFDISIADSLDLSAVRWSTVNSTYLNKLRSIKMSHLNMSNIVVSCTI